MEFYTIWAKNKIATEDDNREGPFTTYEQAQDNLTLGPEYDSAVIAIIGGRWCYVEFGDREFYYKDIHDPCGYWR